jgi:hypothetical protein
MVVAASPRRLSRNRGRPETSGRGRDGRLGRRIREEMRQGCWSRRRRRSDASEKRTGSAGTGRGSCELAICRQRGSDGRLRPRRTSSCVPQATINVTAPRYTAQTRLRDLLLTGAGGGAAVVSVPWFEWAAVKGDAAAEVADVRRRLAAATRSGTALCDAITVSSEGSYFPHAVHRSMIIVYHSSTAHLGICSWFTQTRRPPPRTPARRRTRAPP